MTGANAPAGWYPDSDARRLRYWDGERWTGHLAERRAAEPQGSQRNWVALGIVSTVLAVPAAGALFLLAVFSSNACGLFGDGCEEYGQRAAGFELFVLGTVLAIAVAVAGFIVAVTSAIARQRRR